MTKKHFTAIAKIIKDNSTTIEKADGTIMHVLPYSDTINALSDYFESENPQFDHDRFMEACGIID